MEDLLVIGEALIDVVRRTDGSQQEHVGGSPANVAFGLARLGHPTRLLTRIGADPHGDAVRAHLDGAGVRVVEGSLTAGPTSTATATLDAAGLATYEFDLRWELPADAPVGVPVAVHTGSIAAVLDPGAERVERILDRLRGRSVVTYDPNARPTLMGAPEQALARIERLVALSDVVKVSDEDVAWLVPGADPVDVARHWLGLGPALVVVTRGSAGATAVLAAGTTTAAAPPIDLVDTVGAGDAFMSGLLDGLATAGLLHVPALDDIRAAAPAALTGIVAHAVTVAAITCTRAGAQPPTRAEVDAWVSR